MLATLAESCLQELRDIFVPFNESNEISGESTESSWYSQGCRPEELCTKSFRRGLRELRGLHAINESLHTLNTFPKSSRYSQYSYREVAVLRFFLGIIVEQRTK